MTDDEFDQFLHSAVHELQDKQEELTTAHRLGSYERFWFDQEQASLDFSDAQGVTDVRANVVPIGTWSVNSNTWKWAWANESILATLREKSASLKALASKTGFALFEQELIQADEAMAWELTAIAVQHLGALGAYRVPGERSHLYLAVSDLRHVGTDGWVS